MSRRPKGGAKADICVHCGLSRRQVLAGSAALALPAGNPAPPDPVISACQDWIRLDTEHEGLIFRWQTLESQAVREFNWFRLSEIERHQVPLAPEMSAVEARLESSFESRHYLLTQLADMTAATLQGICLKLAVAAKAVPVDENPEAHALLQGTLKDFQALLEAGAPPLA